MIETIHIQTAGPRLMRHPDAIRLHAGLVRCIDTAREGDVVATGFGLWRSDHRWTNESDDDPEDRKILVYRGGRIRRGLEADISAAQGQDHDLECWARQMAFDMKTSPAVQAAKALALRTGSDRVMAWYFDGFAVASDVPDKPMEIRCPTIAIALPRLDTAHRQMELLNRTASISRLWAVI